MDKHKTYSMLIKLGLKYFLILLGVISLLFLSCKKVNDPNEDNNLTIDYDLVKTSITLKFTDAVSGEMIPDNANLKVTAVGEQSDAVLDITGRKKEFYSGKMGVVELALKPGHELSGDLPFGLTLDVKASGYFSSSFSKMLSNEGSHIFEISMIRKDDLPEGVSKGNGTSYSDGQGRVTQTASVSVNNHMASILVPEGAVLRSGDNNPLTGNINISLYHFSNLADATLKSFPGTLRTSAQLSEAITKQVMFFTAGYVFVSIHDENGNFAKSIDGSPLTLSVNVPAATFNSESSAQVNDGDLIPVWHFDNEKSSWSLEYSDTINSSSPGVFTINSLVRSLSWWSWNWYEDNLCESGTRIDFNDEEISCDCYWVKLEARNPFNQSFLWQEHRRICEAEPMPMSDVPSGMPVDLYFSGMCESLTTTDAFYSTTNLCTQNTIEVDWNLPGEITSFQLELIAYCGQQEEVKIRPSIGIWYKKTNDYCWQWTEMRVGKARMCNMQAGVDYQIGFYYDGSWEAFHVVPQYGNYIYHDFTFNAEVCSEVFGY